MVKLLPRSVPAQPVLEFKEELPEASSARGVIEVQNKQATDKETVAQLKKSKVVARETTKKAVKRARKRTARGKTRSSGGKKQ